MISFQDGFSGVDDELEIDVLNRCESCDGTGSQTPEGVRVCPTCDG